MKATFWQEGNNIDFTNGGSEAIAFGDVIDLGSRIGVAADDIAVGETGVVSVVGAYKMAKAAEALTAGQLVYYNGTAITGTATDNTPAGWAVLAAASADTECLIKLLG